MFSKLNKVKASRPRIAYITLNDGLHISPLRTLAQNVNLFETRFGMLPHQSEELAQAIQRVFKASSS